jgi:parvulin-like peptidyl-prolyl isomerase
MQKATELGLAPLNEEEKTAALTEADAIWEENIQYYVSSSHPELTAESAEADVQAARDEAIAYLNEAGYSQEFIRSSYSQSVVLNRLYEQLVQDVAITDADVEAEYQAQVAADKALYENDLNAYVAYNNNVEMNNMYMMYTGQGVQMDYAWYRPAGFRGVKHILLKVDDALMQEYNSVQAALEEQLTAEGEADTTEPAATQADLDNAKAAILAANQEKIDEINQRIANGEDFEALISEYTLDSDSLYEVCVASTNYVPEFVEAAFSVDNVGDVSAPYISQFGIHIVKYMEDIPAGPIEMTEEQRQLKYEQLLTSRQDDAYAAKVDEWKAASTVEYTGLVQSYEELLQSLIAEEEAAVTEDTPAEEAVAETPIEVTEAPAAE